MYKHINEVKVRLKKAKGYNLKEKEMDRISKSKRALRDKMPVGGCFYHCSTFIRLLPPFIGITLQLLSHIHSPYIKIIYFPDIHSSRDLDSFTIFSKAG